HPDRGDRLAGDLADEAQALVDGKALANPERGARKPARPESQRLQRFDENIIFRCGKAADGLNPLRRLGGGLEGWHAHVTCPQNEQLRTKTKRLFSVVVS